MKISHVSILALMFICISTLSLDVQAILDAGQSFCGENGKADFQLSYYGSKISFEDAKVTVLKKSSNEMFNITGTWNADNAIFSSNDMEQAFPKFTSEHSFTARGAYVVTFSVGKENAIFTIVCPGIPCKEDNACKDSEFCGPDEVCESLSCTGCQYPTSHSCMERCNDNNICTQDTCNAGICENSYISNCCLTDKNCNDGLVCTKDICRNYRCAHEEVTCQKKDECSIPSCKEFIGCTADINQTCIKEKDKLAWFFASSVFGKILKFLHLL